MLNPFETGPKRCPLAALLCGICLMAGALAGCTKTASDLPKLSSMKGAVLDLFDSPPLSESNPTAEATYQDGLNYFERERYDRAIFYFQKVRDEFPFSPEAEQAELKIADAFYRNEEYAEAAEAYKNYLAFQPTSEHAHTIKYKLGLVHYDQFSRVDRDQKNIKEAKRYFETLLKDHPESEHVPDAQEKLAKTREYLAEREFLIGRFYLQERKYLAARARFENVLRDYMDTPTAVKSLYMLGDAYRLEKNNVKATLAYEALIERYPESAYAEQARAYLADLETEKQDPLASLLMEDGLPTGIETPDTQVAGAFTGSNPQVGLVTKEAYEHEEIRDTSLLSSLNPFSSDKTDGGEQAVEAEAANEASEKSFFSSLNPFSSSDNTETDTQESVSGDGTTSLVSSIDTSLEAQGVAGETLTQAPESDLPDIPKEAEPPQTDPAELLSNVDQSLAQQGGEAELPETPELHEVFDKPLPPEPTEEEKLAAAEKARAAAAETTAGLLDNLDRTLENKGIEQPNIEMPEAKPVDTAAREAAEVEREPVELEPRLVKTTDRVELEPRLGADSEAAPLMLDQGEFALSRPEEDGKDSASSTGTRNDVENETAAVRSLPESVITGVPEKSKPKTVETQAVSGTASGTKSAASEDWDAEPNPVDTMADQVDKASQVLNPLSW